VFGKKDHDYNSTTGVKVDILDYYKDNPNEALMHDINRKVLRLKSLIFSGREADNESIDDNFEDLLNYVRIGYAVYKHYKAIEELKSMPSHTPKERKKKKGKGNK
jgi:hypothetical protein